jgi:thiamine biosynthesis lipoprotein
VEVEGISSRKMVLKLEDLAAATSGITRRKWEIDGKKYHHLINPLDPYKFSFDLKSVTVIKSSCEEVDFWAKVLFIAGREKGALFAKRYGIACIFLDYRGNICETTN